jgi:acetoin utilization deacetylase AcuC-like enzyme
MKQIGYFTHSDCMIHDMGHMHPESPMRLQAIDTQLQADGLMLDLTPFEAFPAEQEWIERAHPHKYVHEIHQIGCNAVHGELIPVDGDTSMGPGSLRAALLAAGAGCQAVDRVMAGDIERAFCATRPPGHHAEKSLAMGFCLFNNIAVAALHAIEQHGLSRVSIIDFDVHNGNGTVDIFKDDERVMVCSSFQHPFYPNRHFDTPGEHLILTPINAGSDGTVFRHKVEQEFLPALDEFKPELILISAGFDAHTKDPLGELNLVEDDYRWITTLINDVANRHCQSRIVSILEGGYHLGALGRSVCAHIEMMLND